MNELLWRGLEKILYLFLLTSASTWTFSFFLLVAGCEIFILNSIKLSFSRYLSLDAFNLLLLKMFQHKLLWIFHFCLLSTRMPQPGEGRERNSRQQKFTFFALRHKINYYQIRSRFSYISASHHKGEARKKVFPQLRLKTSLRNLCFPALRHISIHSTLSHSFNCLHKLFKRE